MIIMIIKLIMKSLHGVKIVFSFHMEKHIHDWNNGTEMQHTALKAAFVLLAVGLQKPSKKIKGKRSSRMSCKAISTVERGRN